MARIAFLFLLFLSVGAQAAPKSDLWAFWQAERQRSGAPNDHDVWGELLQRYRSVGADGVARFDYGAVSQADHTALNGYVEALSAADPRDYAKPVQMAYWINFYNALTVKVILDHYPVDGIRDIDISPGWFSSGPWGKKLVRVAGQELSLDDMEHRILRPIWRDPRIHYAVNCASIGCPDLAAEPFRAATLEGMLDAAARAYINHPRGVGFYHSGKLRLSSIYDWFEEDFGADEQELIAHLQRYAEPDLTARIKAASGIGGYDYDWGLNRP